MKALTLHQPWATLAVLGHKKYETRSWSTKYRGPLMIHASKATVFIAESFMKALLLAAGLNAAEFHLEVHFPLGRIVGQVDIRNCQRTEDIEPWLPNEQLVLGDFSSGRYAWEMEKPIEFKKTIALCGHQGLWTVPAKIERQIRAQLERAS